MADLCTIGPVSIANAHIFDASSYAFSSSATKTVVAGGTIVQRGSFTETYKFAVDCTFAQALQLKGVVEQGEVIWLNTSDLTDNDYLQHKGWVVLTSMDISEENPYNLCECTIEYIKISDYEGEYLTMDYSRGLYDGINIEHTYEPTVARTNIVDENGSTVTNWTSAKRAYVKSGNGTSTGPTAGTGISFGLTASTSGVYNTNWTMYSKSGSQSSFAPPFSISFDLTPASTSITSTRAFSLALCPDVFGDGSKTFENRTDWFEVYFNITNTTKKYGVRTVNKGKVTNIRNPTATTATTVSFMVEFLADGRVNIYRDTTGTSTFTATNLVYSGTSATTNFAKGMNIYLSNINSNTTIYTPVWNNIKLWKNTLAKDDNIVMMPPVATLQLPADGTRTVEDGTASYYANPTSELRYQIPTANYYSGGVKLFSSNNSSSTSRQVFSTGTKLTPTTTILKNGLTQLTFGADRVNINAWYGGTYNNVQVLTFPSNITYIKPLFISNERISLQINDTKWTMLRSSPVITVEHPNTPLGYTLKTVNYHDGSTTGSPFAAGATVTMQNLNTGYYSLVYNTADTYRMLIVKQDPTDIKSDSIPAANITGIGWINGSGSGYDAADSVARQWYKQTRTGISL
jgi:hypothetical protein